MNDATNAGKESLTYDEICRIIGALHLEFAHKQRGLESQAKAVIDQLQSRAEALESEKSMLESSLSDLTETPDKEMEMHETL